MLNAQSEGRDWLQPVEIFLGNSTDSRGEYSDSKGESIIMFLSKLRTVHLNYASIKWNT